jgi:outer membrane receptor protein involved in Fe transport
VALNLTHVQGRHTFKAGGYLNHSYKAQNTGAGGIANLTFQGYVDFGNNTNNTLDSGFGYANADLGIFNQYQQASKFIEGDYLYNQIEFYVQDTWKVTNRLTLDYGMRFVHQQPQYDKLDQSSNFFSNQWQTSVARCFTSARPTRPSAAPEAFGRSFAFTNVSECRGWKREIPVTPADPSNPLILQNHAKHAAKLELLDK